MSRQNLRDKALDAVQSTMARNPGTTVRIACSDTASALPGVVTLNGGVEAKGVLITCEDNGIRFAFNTSPTSGTAGLGHVLAANQSLMLAHPAQVTAFRFLNENDGHVAVLQATGMFE